MTKGDQLETEVRAAGSRLMWWALTANVLVLILWLWAVLWLAIPRHDTCLAIQPAATGCVMADRGPVSVITAIAMVGVLAGLARLFARTARPVWLPWMLTAAYAILALMLYRVVLYA